MRLLRFLRRLAIATTLGFPVILFASLVLHAFLYVEPRGRSGDKNDYEDSENNLYDLKTDRRLLEVQRFCNFLSEISIGQELNFELPDGWKLERVIVITRHGDRGPLRPVREQERLVCDKLDLSSNAADIDDYNNKIDSLLVNRFDFVAALPKDYYHLPLNRCHLGQLTRLGVGQHIKLGSELTRLYRPHFGDNFNQTIKLASTFFPRTYQSAWAFAFGLTQELGIDLSLNLPQFDFNYGSYFCGQISNDEYCRSNGQTITRLAKSLQTLSLINSTSFDVLTRLIENSREIISPDEDGEAIRAKYRSIVSIYDGFNAYLCHQEALPCRAADGRCLTAAQYRKVAAYLEQLGRIFIDSDEHFRLNFLRAYGLIARIIDIAKGTKEEAKLWLFSGHDLTLEALSSALKFYNGHIPPYASRLIIEIFHVLESNQNELGIARRWKLLRFIYNGKDVTRFLDVCRNRQLCVEYQFPSSNSSEASGRYFIELSIFEQHLSSVYRQLSSDLTPLESADIDNSLKNDLNDQLGESEVEFFER